MEDKLEIRKVDGKDVYFRKLEQPLTSKSQFEELELMIKYLTGEEFEDYDGKFKRRLINPKFFRIIKEYKDDCISDYICICSEDTCNHLLVIKYIPKEIYFSVGSVCYLRFNEENSTELYYETKAKKSRACNTPLVFRDGEFKKNTEKIYRYVFWLCKKNRCRRKNIFICTI